MEDATKMKRQAVWDKRLEEGRLAWIKIGRQG
jgi:hypothetical protein